MSYIHSDACPHWNARFELHCLFIEISAKSCNWDTKLKTKEKDIDKTLIIQIDKNFWCSISGVYEFRD